MAQNIEIEQGQLAEVCRRHHIQKLSLFGSMLRNDFGPASDVDVLVRFDPAYPVGFRIFDIEVELSVMFDGHRVDVVNEKFVNARLRDRIFAEAQVQYPEG